jgi:hypothetical protein
MSTLSGTHSRAEPRPHYSRAELLMEHPSGITQLQSPGLTTSRAELLM